MIVLDDTGFAQLGCFGAEFATPNIDRLAAGGLSYNRFHVTALCSPTRAALLTGRNAHAVGMGFLADIAMSHPGYTGRIPPSAATLPRLLRDAGWATMAIGKWHLAPRFERSAAGPFTHWPTGLGFERFYGVLHGGANFWTPNLAQDQHFIDPPAGPEDGYHLSVDLADQVIRHISDQKHAAPDKPFFCYYAEVATHAPHHVSPEWVEPYRGLFDDGWESLRHRIFERQVRSGIVPSDTTLTERPSWVPPWDELDPDARRLFARMHEVFAGFVSHTDAQIGRVLDHLEATGELDNTIVMLCSDNGASAEGGVVGSVNEHRFTKGLPESVEANLEWIDELGGPRTYNHYPWGWAWAGNTPFKLWKRYSWLGGTRTPLIVHWPEGIEAAGEVRTPFCHANDLMPTVLDACGVEVPDRVDGIVQQRLDGESLVPTFGDPTSPGTRTRQYFEVQGSRAMYLDGWKATTDHVGSAHADELALLEGSRAFEDDRWTLHDLTNDFSEAHDLAASHPERVAEMEAAWFAEADANDVLPLDDGFVGRVPAVIAPAYPPPRVARYRAGASRIADEMLPVMVRGFTMTVDATVGEGGAHGILAAWGDWTSGLALYGLDGHLVAALSLSGDPLELVSPHPIADSARSLGLGCRVTSADSCELSLFVDGHEVAASSLDRSLPNSWQNGGTGLIIGHDSGFPVSDAYRSPFPWTGVIDEVRIEVPDTRPASPSTLVEESLRSD